MRIFVILIMFFCNLNLLYGITLEQAVNEALKNNHKINSAKLNFEASTYKFKAAKALRMPSFFVDSSYTKLNSSVKLNFPTPIGTETITITEQDYISLTTGIKLNIYTGGLISGSISKALNEKNAYENIVKETKLDVKYNTQIAYINILELYAYEKIAEKHLHALKKHYDDSTALYKEGIVSYLDMLQTDVKVKEAVQKLTSIKNSIKVAKTNLAIILGRYPSDNITVTDTKNNFIKKLDISKLYEFAKENRPILKILTAQIKAADASVEIASSGYKPKLYLMTGYKYSDVQDDIKDKESFMMQAGVKFQLDWDKSFNEVNAAKKSKLALIRSREDMLSQVLLGVKKAYEDYNTAISNLKVAKTSVKSAKEYFRTMKLKYKEGLSDNSDLLDAEAMLTNALMTEKNHYFDIIKKYFLIERVTGTENL